MFWPFDKQVVEATVDAAKSGATAFDYEGHVDTIFPAYAHRMWKQNTARGMRWLWRLNSEDIKAYVYVAYIREDLNLSSRLAFSDDAVSLLIARQSLEVLITDLDPAAVIIPLMLTDHIPETVAAHIESLMEMYRLRLFSMLNETAVVEWLQYAHHEPRVPNLDEAIE